MATDEVRVAIRGQVVESTEYIWDEGAAEVFFEGYELKPNGFREKESDPENRVIWRFVDTEDDAHRVTGATTLSWSSKSNFVSKFLAPAMGVDDLRGKEVNLDDLLGTRLKVMIENVKQKDGSDFAKVTKVISRIADPDGETPF